MTNVDYRDLGSFRDIETLNYARLEAAAGRPVDLDVVRARSRDNARSPMQWDGSSHAGFTTGEPWLAVPIRKHQSAQRVARVHGRCRPLEGPLVAPKTSEQCLVEASRGLLAGGG